MAQVFPGRSPYEYTFSNPVRYTDPTGMAPDHEYEVTHDQNGKEVKKKVSDLGGDQVDFEHYMDGKNAGYTKVTVNQGNYGSVWIDSEAIRGYRSRNSNQVGPGTIFSEWWNGTGPEKSLFLESDINYANCGKSGTCRKKQDFVFELGGVNSKIGYELRKAYLERQGNVWIKWGLGDVLSEPGEWSQMIGSSWGTMKKFSNSSLVLYMIQDTKSQNSFYLHIPGKIGMSEKNRVSGQRTPEGKTYQTYIWFEWQSVSRSKVNQYERMH